MKIAIGEKNLMVFKLIFCKVVACNLTILYSIIYLENPVPMSIPNVQEKYWSFSM